MVHCAVPFCKTNSKMDKKMSFHQFPCDEKRLKLWLENINKTNPLGSKWTPNQYSTICGLHFMESDFKPFLKNKVLKQDAVPTIFSFSKDSKPSNTRSKQNRKASIPKKTPNKESVSADENIHLMDIDNTSGYAAEHDQAGSYTEQALAGSEEQDEVGFDEEQDQVNFEEEQDEVDFEEQDQVGFKEEQDQVDFEEEQDQIGFAEEQGEAGSYRENYQVVSDVEQDQVGSDAERGQAGSDGEMDQVSSDAEKDQADGSYVKESNHSKGVYHSEPTSKRATIDPANISLETIYPISGAQTFYTPKHLKTLIRESKIKCAEKKLALVKEKLASKVVSRALQKALVVSKIKAETAKMDFYERKKIFLLQTKISHLKNEVPVSEEKFQTVEYLQSKINEEELATRIEERALQKQLFEAEIQASNEKQTYYVTKKTWLPIFMDHSNMK